VRVLITGIGGFVGGHLWRHLHETLPDADIHGTVLEDHAEFPSEIEVHTSIDLRDDARTRRLLADLRPDHIYHLAAQSSPSLSRQQAWTTLETNIRSQLNLIEGCLSVQFSPRILVISTGDIYGNLQTRGERIHEETPFCPRNPYAVSKATQDMLGLQYALSDHLPIIRARPFNHTGPGQNLGFVVPDYAARIADIEINHKEPVLLVRNPSARRDFSDVRDVVRAYRLLMENGTQGEAYNIAAGRTRSVQEVVDGLLRNSAVAIRPIYGESHGHANQVSAGFQVDTTRLFRTTGWQAEIPFEQTLLDVLNDWRQRVQQTARS
jgi:GDP-4-dehydro-6-deoxy-D-mannose reductase